MRAADLNHASRRIALLRVLLLFFFVVLAARAAHLTVVGQGKGGQRVENQIHTTVVLPATRGMIVDRNGAELAVTLHSPSIYVMPKEIRGDRASLVALARELGVETPDLANRLKGRAHFTFVARWAAEDVAERVQALKLPGVGIVREPRRAYPANVLAASLLGFANIDGEGVRGIEQQEDEWLKGSRIRVPVERDARGRLLSRRVIMPRDAAGGDVALTIDASMQAEAEAALRDAIERSGAEGGTVITMDPHSGEILALAEAPGFNPNDFRHVDYRDTRSPAFLDAVEPGSTFKAFVVATALNEGVIQPGQVFDTGDGTISLPGKLIRDHHPHGVLDPAGVLRVSSNVGIVQIAQLLGPQRYFDSLRRFGFGLSTGSGFPMESAGLLRPWQSWKPIDHATVAFGQGVSVTTLQLASAMSVLAGGGVWRQPRIVAARRSPTGRWQRTRLAHQHPVISAKSALTVLRMLEGVVSSTGTGRKAGLEGLRVSGKTGTAQKFDHEQNRYSKSRYIAWFMGAVPADDPRIVVVAQLDEPKGPAHGGGDVAAPLFARVAASQLAHLGIITQPKPIPAAPRPTLLAAGKSKPEDPKPTLLPAVSTSAAANPKGPRPSRRVAARPVTGSAPQSTLVASRKLEPSSSSASLMQTKPSMPRAVIAARAADGALSRGPVRAGTESRVPSTSTPAGIPDAGKAERPVMMPDFRGETVDSARALAARDSLDIEVTGRGLAIRQEPSPGTVVVGSRRRVRVYFSYDHNGSGEG